MSGEEFMRTSGGVGVAGSHELFTAQSTVLAQRAAAKRSSAAVVFRTGPFRNRCSDVIVAFHGAAAAATATATAATATATATIV